MLNQYSIIKVLSENKSGIVYLVRHNQLQVTRILKCINKSHLSSQYYSNESIILSKVHHEKIPILYEVQEDNNVLYIVMQYFEGQSLRAFRSSCNCLTEKSILNISMQICKIIQYLHLLKNPILYLDLKPENLIIKNNEVYLIDFGASIFKMNQKVGSYSKGTVGYAAPEQYQGKILDERADIYGIGMLMYYLVTGQVCNKEKTIWNIDRSLGYSSHLKKVINTCIQEKKFLRYSSISQVMRELTGRRYLERVKKDSGIAKNIAVIGSEAGVGTTTVALIIQAYLNHYKEESVVLEKNPSGDMIKMINTLGNFEWRENSYSNGKFQIVPYNMLLSEECFRDKILIKDYGNVNTCNREEYLKADICLYVSRISPWKDGIREFIKFKEESTNNNIRFIGNYSNTDTVALISEKYQVQNIYSFPYSALFFNKSSWDVAQWQQLKKIIYM